MPDQRRLRAERIRAARARNPMPSYQAIATEVGCSVSTVYNVLKGRSFEESLKWALEEHAPTLAKLAASGD